MKAEELRIGNHISQGEVMEIKENVVRVKYTSDKERTSLIRYEDIQPIPLSEDVLLKCGFTIHPNGYISHEELSRIECEYIEVIMNTKSHIVEHLHQLQNLFYAITGEELEVKWH